MIVVLALAVGLFVFGARALRRAFGPVAAADVFTVIASEHLDDTGLVRLLIDRCLSRARRFRSTTSVAAWAGVLTIVVARAVSGAHQFGVSLGTLFLAGIGGYLLGAILGETHHLRRPPTAVRVVSVAPRSVDGYRTRYLHLTLIAGTAAAILATGASVAGARAVGTSHHHLVLLVAGAATAIGVAVVVNGMQRRVVWRPRPALPAALAHADDVLRARALATLDAAGGALVWMLTSMASGGVASTATSSILGASAGLGSIVAACVAVWLAFHARHLAWPATSRWSSGPIRQATRT